MVRPRSESTFLSSVGNAVGSIRDFVVPVIAAGIKQKADEAFQHMQERILELQARLFRAAAVWVLILAATAAFALGCAFIAVDYLGVSRGIALLACALILAAIALILHLTRVQSRTVRR